MGSRYAVYDKRIASFVPDALIWVGADIQRLDARKAPIHGLKAQARGGPAGLRLGDVLEPQDVSGCSCRAGRHTACTSRHATASASAADRDY